MTGSPGSPSKVVWNSPAEDDDPRPPAQEPQDGRL
jgi:hypothetical protein